MIIEALSIKNYRGIKEVSITPGTRKLVVIAGKNGQGKSSLLDGIITGLGGGRIDDMAVRKGETEAQLQFKLSNGLLITKTISTNDKPKLVITSALDSNVTYKKPQEILDQLGAKLINPIEFQSSTPKQRAEIFKRITGLDFSDIDRDIKANKEFITEFNRDLKQLEQQAENLKNEGPLLDKPVDISGLLQAQQEQNKLLHQKALDQASLQTKLNRRLEIHTQLLALKAEMSAVEAEATTLQNSLDALDAQPTEVDYSQAIEEASNSKAAYDRFVRLGNLKKDYIEKRKKAQTADDIVSSLVGERDRRLSEAPLPIPGLSLEGDFVAYKGIPFESLSSGEQLRVSLAMAIAMRGDLDVMIIPNASLLDEESMESVAATAEAHNLQLWLEIVGEDSEPGSIVIVEGEAING